MNQSEKRLFKRLETNLDVELSVQGKQIRTQTTNISCGGLFLKLNPNQIQNHKDIDLKIYLPNRHRPIQLTAKLLRKERESALGVALQFDGLYNDNILAIEQFIKSNFH